jgi:predicted dehydrogenase
MAKKLKVAVLGVGSIWKAHLPGWRQSADAELYALCDINPEALKKAGEETGNTKLYERPEDLFSDREVDIVDVCTANAYHAPLSLAALRAGKHVLCEKPLAVTPDEIRQLIAARDKSGKMLMAAQHMRFDDLHAAMKSEIQTGRLGEIYHARSWFLRRDGYPTRPTFISKERSGGGACLDIGVHALDLMLWLMGNPRPVSVSGITQDKIRRQPDARQSNGKPIPEFFDVEEFAAGFIRFDTGATAILETSWLLHQKEAANFRVWLYGSRGGAALPDGEIYSTNPHTNLQHDLKLKPEGGSNAHAAECIAFADAIAWGKPSPVPAEQSLAAVAILDGIYRSTTTRKEVTLEL